MDVSPEKFIGFNHPNDRIEPDSKKANIYHRFVGSLGKSFKFKYHEFYPGYDSLKSFSEYGERKVLDDYWLTYVKPDSIVIDVGASYGIYTLASLLAGAHIVYSFEPIRPIFESLSKNIQLNDWSDRSKLYNELIWSSSGITVKFDDEKFTTAVNTQIGNQYTTKSIDDLGIDGVDMIKIDVEGVELDVLYGAINTIYKSKPYILIEIHADLYGLKHVYDMIQYFFGISIQLQNTMTKTTIKNRDYVSVEFI